MGANRSDVTQTHVHDLWAAWPSRIAHLERIEPWGLGLQALKAIRSHAVESRFAVGSACRGVGGRSLWLLSSTRTRWGDGYQAEFRQFHGCQASSAGGSRDVLDDEDGDVVLGVFVADERREEAFEQFVRASVIGESSKVAGDSFDPEVEALVETLD